jgi:uncharacterized membrane protein
MQVPLAIVAGLFGIVRSIQGGGLMWGLAATLILGVIPFTLVVIRPTNNRLLDARRDRRSDETLNLLRSWGRLHAVRSAVSVVAAILFIWAAAR